MESTAPKVWHELKQEFTYLNDSELRSALCRLHHYECKDVHTLRDSEIKVKSWLDEKTIERFFSDKYPFLYLTLNTKDSDLALKMKDKYQLELLPGEENHS